MVNKFENVLKKIKTPIRTVEQKHRNIMFVFVLKIDKRVKEL